MKSLVIDVSRYNKVTWANLDKSVNGVMIRCGYRGNTSGMITIDSAFLLAAAQCKNKGIPFGLYFMSQAISMAEGVEEAEFAVSQAIITGATLPIFIDSEDGDGTAKVVRADNLDKTARTLIALAFCKQVSSMGRQAGVYASDSWFKDHLDLSAFSDYLIWVAKYGRNNGKMNADQLPVYVKHWDMWQYTSNGRLKGISGKVDINACYFIEVEKSACYPKYTGKGTLLVALLEVGCTDNMLTHRKKIAVANGIAKSEAAYTGTKDQNLQMLNLLKAGHLFKA